MGSIGCPLCCQHDFISVVALHEHLLYYVYRPLQCALCSTHVGGIQELTHHLERHLGESLSTALRQPKAASDQTTECGQDVPMRIDAFPQGFDYSQENSATLAPGTSNFYGTHDKSGWKKWGENVNVMSPRTREEPIELTLRAFFCQTCGAKVVGKDNYFSHIKQHISRPSNFIPNGPLSTHSSCHQEASSPFWNDAGPSSPNALSVNTTPVNVLTDSETATSEGTREATGSPETQISDCIEENNVANQLLKLREWQLAKHGRRFRKHHLSFSSSPRASNQSPNSEKLLYSVSPSTIIDPGSVERPPLSQISGPGSVDEISANTEPLPSLLKPPNSGFSVDTATTEVFSENLLPLTLHTPVEELNNVNDHGGVSHVAATESENVLSPCPIREQDDITFPEAGYDVPLDDCIVSPMDSDVGKSVHTNVTVHATLSPLDNDVSESFPTSPNIPATLNDIYDASLCVTTASGEKIGSSTFSSNSWMSPHQPVQDLVLEAETKSELRQRKDASPNVSQPVEVTESEFLSPEKSTVSTSGLQSSQEFSGNVVGYSNPGLTDSVSHNVHLPALTTTKFPESVPNNYQASGSECSDLSKDLRFIDKTQEFVSETLTDIEILPGNFESSHYDDLTKAPSGDEGRPTICEDVLSVVSSDGVISDTENKRKSSADSDDLHLVDSKPYLHKKFHHDQERKVVPTGGIGQNADVSRYIHSFQSLLVSKLNGTLSVDVPFESERLSLEVNKTMTDTTKNSDSSTLPQTPTNEYVCEVCNLKCTNRSTYRAHYRLHEVEGQKNFTCQYCDKKFFKKRSKDLHLRKHTGEKTHRCGLCPQVFTKLYTFLRHKEEVHADKKRFVCAECSKGFSSQRQLQNHIGVHQREKVYKCNYCDHACQTPGGIRTHKLSVHTNEQRREHKCEVCNECFKKLSGLKRHNQRKHSLQQLPCELCTKVYSCHEDLLQHRKTHNTEPLRCDHCEKTFTSSWSLQRHSVIHESATHPYKCNKCSVTFTRSDSLTCHMKLHSQKKVHICSCGKRFVKKSQLKAHEDKHSSVPRHTCSLCNRAFKFKISLRNHNCKVNAIVNEEISVQ